MERPRAATVEDVPYGLRHIDPDVRAEAVLFWNSFAGQPDLDHLSDAGRRILAVAAALFLRHGAVSTSVRDIARAGGLSPGALYNHFESKQALLYTLVHHGHSRVHRRLDVAVIPADPPLDQLRAFVRSYVVGHLEHLWLAQVVRREYFHLTDERLTAVVAQRRAIRSRLAGILRAGVERGDVTLLADGGETSLAIMVLDLCRATTDWYGPRQTGDADALAARYVLAAERLVGAR